MLGIAINGVRAWRILEKGISPNANDWRWGAIHHHFYEHIPFSVIPGFKQIFHREAEAIGNRRTLSMSIYDYYHNDLEKRVDLRSNFAPNFRFAIDMNEFHSRAYMSLDTGISGSIFSEHYFDMNEWHYSNTCRENFFEEKTVKNNARYVLKLIPIQK